MAPKRIPYSFVLDYLPSVDATVKPMFGMHAIYVNDKIMLMLRERKIRPDKNGVWIATQQKHRKSLKAELPSMCSISDFSRSLKKETEWQILPASSRDFEASVMKVCSMICRGDQRIGRIPKRKK